MRRRTYAAPLVLCLALAPRAALGLGYESPDNGTRPLGHAGAFTARADDATALQYNVAGLAGQRPGTLLFDLNLIDPHLCFTRMAEGGRAYPESRYEYGDGRDDPFVGKNMPRVCDEGGFHGSPLSPVPVVG